MDLTFNDIVVYEGVISKYSTIKPFLDPGDEEYIRKATPEELKQFQERRNTL